MDDEQMREAFEAAAAKMRPPMSVVRGPNGQYARREAFMAWKAWKAARQFAYAAGMERAKIIAIACDRAGLSVGDVIDTIRAEIKGANL